MKATTTKTYGIKKTNSAGHVSIFVRSQNDFEGHAHIGVDAYTAAEWKTESGAAKIAAHHHAEVFPIVNGTMEY